MAPPRLRLVRWAIALGLAGAASVPPTGAARAQFFDPFFQYYAPQAPVYAPQAPVYAHLYPIVEVRASAAGPGQCLRGFRPARTCAGPTGLSVCATSACRAQRPPAYTPPACCAP